MNLDRLVTNFLDELSKNRSKYTILSYEERIKKFTDYLKNKNIQSLNQIDSQLIDNYIAKELKRLSINSNHVYLAVLKWFLGFLYKKNYVFVNLAPKIILPKWKRTPKKIYSPYKIQKIITKITEPKHYVTRNRAIVALHLCEDLSAQEIKNMSMLDLDITEKELRLKSRQKMITLKKETLKYIKDYLIKRPQSKPKSDYMFVTNPYGRQISLRNTRLILRGVLKK
jgi:site-specific recombinase XerD